MTAPAQPPARPEQALNPLAAVEAAHGFTFGGSHTGPGRPVAAVVCTAPGCRHRGQHVQIHDDTVLPVHCGGCGGVLHCDHRPDTATVRGGTIGAPVEHDITTCTACGVELARVSRDLDPQQVLRNLPHAILDQPL